MITSYRAFAILLALVVLDIGFAQTPRVDVRPTVARGVTITSAEFAPELDSSAQILVIRLRNDGPIPAKTVVLSTTLHDARGYAKGGSLTSVEIDAPPGSEQVVSLQVERLEADDSLTLELMEISGASSSSDSNNVFLQDSNQAPASTDWCSFCSVCSTAAYNTCDGGIKSYSCKCPEGPCSYTCFEPDGQ